MPVSFEDFRVGMVERIGAAFRCRAARSTRCRPSAREPNIPTTGPLEIERYVVGVHDETGHADCRTCCNTWLKLGPAVIEAQVPVEQIAAETKPPPRGKEPRHRAADDRGWASPFVLKPQGKPTGPGPL